MATVRMSVTYEDAEGDRVTQALHWDSADVTTVAEAQDAFTDFETLIHDVTGGAIVDAEVSFPLTIAGTETPDAGYSVFSGATLSFRDSDGNGQSLYVPAILQSQIAGQVVNDVATPGMLEFLADVETNGFGTGGHRLSSRGSGALWNTFLTGKRSTRKP